MSTFQTQCLAKYHKKADYNLCLAKLINKPKCWKEWFDHYNIVQHLLWNCLLMHTCL